MSEDKSPTGRFVPKRKSEVWDEVALMSFRLILNFCREDIQREMRSNPGRNIEFLDDAAVLAHFMADAFVTEKDTRIMNMTDDQLKEHYESFEIPKGLTGSEE